MVAQHLVTCIVIYRFSILQTRRVQPARAGLITTISDALVEQINTGGDIRWFTIFTRCLYSPNWLHDFNFMTCRHQCHFEHVFGN